MANIFVGLSAFLTLASTVGQTFCQGNQPVIFVTDFQSIKPGFLVRFTSRATAVSVESGRAALRKFMFTFRASAKGPWALFFLQFLSSVSVSNINVFALPGLFIVSARPSPPRR